MIKWYLNTPSTGIDESDSEIKEGSDIWRWFLILKILAGRSNNVPKVKPHQERGTYLQFQTSCTIFHIAQKQNLESSIETEVSLLISQKRLVKNSKNVAVGYVVLNDIKFIQLLANRHELMVISEARVGGFDPLSFRSFR